MIIRQVGPPVGGLLYSISVFEVPFIVMAAVALLLLLTMPFLKSRMDETRLLWIQR